MYTLTQNELGVFTSYEYDDLDQVIDAAMECDTWAGIWGWRVTDSDGTLIAEGFGPGGSDRSDEEPW